MTTSEEFFRTWKHALSDDFQQNGKPVSSSERWISEALKISTKATSAAISGDGTLLALGVGENIEVYDASTAQLLRVIRGTFGKIVGIELHPRGRKLAAASERYVSTPQGMVRMESAIRLFDLDDPEQPSGKLNDAAKGAARAASAILSEIWSSPDIASASLPEEFARVLLTAQANLDVRHGHAHLGTLPSFGSRAFSSDGKNLLYMPERNVAAVLDTTTLLPSEKFRLVGHSDAIMWAETSPTNNVIATSAWDRTVRLWSPSSGELLRVLYGNGQMWGGAFSPDGGLIAAGSGDANVRIWDTNTGELFHIFGGFGHWVRSLSFSPDGFRLAAGSGSGALKIFNVVSGETEQDWRIDLKGSERMAQAFVEVTRVQYTSRGDLFFKSTEGRIFGYRASSNIKWEWMDPDYDYSTRGLLEFSISSDGFKLAAPFGTCAKIFRVE